MRFALAVHLLIPVSCLAGDLAAVRLEVRDPDATQKDHKPAKRQRRSRASRACDDDDDDHFVTSLLFGLLSSDDEEDQDDAVSLDLTLAFAVAGGIAMTPYWVPKGILSDEGDAVVAMRSRPFETEPFGFLLIDRVDCDTNLVLEGKPFVLDGNVSYATDFDAIDGWGGEIQYDHRSRLGFYGRWRALEERATDDSMNLGSLNVAYRFAQSQRIVMHSGVGFAWLDDPGGSEFGFNWLYRMDYAVFRPLSLGGQLELGKLGDAFASRFSSHARLHYRNVSVFVGSEHFGFDDQFLHFFTSGMALRF